MRHPRLAFCTLLGIVAIVVTTYGQAQSGAATARPPFAAGTSWTYRDRRLEPSGTVRSGTMKVIYGGEATYRGKRVSFMDASYALRPGFTERLYLEWGGSHFRQVANVVTDAQRRALEFVFDRPFRIRAPETASGTVRIFENGTLRSAVPWSYASIANGSPRVTVPAGSFRATRWDTVLRIGDREMRTSFFTVGHTDVRWESAGYAAGAQTGTTEKALVKGPIR
jgi:hypothetical protein